MAEGNDYVYWLRNTTPYINAYRGRTFVLVLNGEALAHTNFSTIVYDIALLSSLGVRLVLVYGLNPQIDNELERHGIVSIFHRHIRVTDERTLSCIKNQIGRAQTMMQAAFSAGIAPSPLRNSRLRLWTGNVITAKPIGILDGVDMQLAGEVRKIDLPALTEALSLQHIVALPNIGFSPTGEVFDLGVEEVATAVAIALKADKIVLSGRGQGIYDEKGNLRTEILTGEAGKIIEQQLAACNPARPLPEDVARLRAAWLACEGGVKRAHLVSYEQDGSLLREIFTRDGTGTMVVRDSYEQTRKAGIDDVGGILSIIAPLEESGILVRRSRELIEREISFFSVIDLDGTTIGCAALYPYPAEKKGELACLAVHEQYREQERGARLLRAIEKQAGELGLEYIFVCTTRSLHWFKERGFCEVPLSFLPPEKQKLYNLKRNSVVLTKEIG